MSDATTVTKAADAPVELTAKPSDSKPSDTKETTTDDSASMYNYIFVAVLSVVLILLLYYAYCRFAENSVDEPFVKGQTQERDDPVIDFNLREAIRELQNIQRNIMSTISDNSDI
jgi:cytochrome c-type biogenesis protein CcmH/NrfG